MTIGIIDYAAGNLGSVYRALEELKINARILDKPGNLSLTDGWILPGVGNFTESANRLSTAGWVDTIFEEVHIKQKPFLGICLGMQLMADYGVEGAKDNSITPGLKLIPGYVESLTKMGCKSRIPHIGWNSLNVLKSGALLSDIPSGTDFYFVHSYAFVAEDEDAVKATVDYDIPVPAVIGRDNIWGTQFHPEKSSKAGFKVLENFFKGQLC